MRILLDTHALIWFLTDSPKLPTKIRALLLAEDSELFFSSVSVLEVAIKHSLKPDLMPCLPEEVRSFAESSAICELAFESRHAVKIGELPKQWTIFPCCTAIRSIVCLLPKPCAKS